MKNIIYCLILFSSVQASAWSMRGHETVGSLAAQLLGKEQPGAGFLVNHTYDMGYYNNTPDIIWKAKDETYKKESNQHFMDMETYDKTFTARKDKNGWSPDRQKFFKKFPEIDAHAGRSYWRIEELNNKVSEIAKKLKNKKLDIAERQKLQLEWLTTAGVMGHYVADLCQPLHVTENYDGQMTDQKGVHHWFEGALVDQLYPLISAEIYNRAKQRWPEFHKKNKNTKVFELMRELGKNSWDAIQPLLELDKATGREDINKAAEAFKEMITERQALGVLYLAEVWSRQLEWPYEGKKFYSFTPALEYIDPVPDKK